MKALKIIKYLLVGLIMVCITMLISTLTIYLTNKYSLNSVTYVVIMVNALLVLGYIIVEVIIDKKKKEVKEEPKE